jgi:hypothetical protein
MFSEGTLSSYRNNTLEISFGSDKSLFIDSIQRSKEKVKSALDEFFGTSINFTCVKTQMSSEEKEAHMKKRIISSTQNLIRKIIDKEPIIQNIIDTFEGESLVVRTNGLIY